MIVTYVLDENKNPVPEPDALKWGRWFEKANRHLSKWECDGVLVSTVFLGCVHMPMEIDGKPVLWETMVRGLEGPGEWSNQLRYSSASAALEGHDLTVKRVQAVLARRKQEA